MDKAITIGMVLEFILIGGGVLTLGALLLFIIWLMNPFRTGH